MFGEQASKFTQKGGK